MEENTSNSVHKTSAPLSVKITGFLVSLSWYMYIVAGVLLVFIYMTFAMGFKPENLHVQIPVEVNYLTQVQQQNLLDVQRPKITAFAGYATMLVRESDMPYFIFMMTIALGIYLLIGWGIYQLRMIIKSVKAGDVFNKANPKRIRIIAYITMVSGPLINIGLYIQAVFYRNNINFPGAVDYEVVLDSDGTTILLGLVILVLAYVFEHGMHLQEEQELTI